jgi:hypothetical protein
MGEAFGEPNCVRFSFANSMTNIERAWIRIKEALGNLKLTSPNMKLLEEPVPDPAG